jgi:AbrB family looped-hinge helix DNA binding protein
MSTFVAVQKRGTIALPPDIRARLGLDKPGAQLEITERDGEIVLRPYVAVPADQAWFWEPAWQSKEREVDAYVQVGQTTEFEDSGSLVEHLEAIVGV